MSSISEAIASWQEEKLSGSALMREVVSYKQWSVAVSEAAAATAIQEGALPAVMFHKDEQGVSRLSLFSDTDAYKRFCQAGGEADVIPQTFLTTTGACIFQMPLETMDMICIDPGTPPDINYRQEHLPRLRKLAQAVEVEDALAVLRAGEESPENLLKRVRDYAGYMIAIHKVEDSYSLALAPDAQGRALAAVFTFEDSFDAYYPECKQMYPDGELLILPLAGPTLFAQLLERNLTGMVFNCAGPGTPIAFALPFAEVVLNAEPRA